MAKTLFSADGTSAGVIRQPIDLPLEDESGTRYLVHPQGFPRVDVVAIPIQPERVHEGRVTLSSGESHVTRQALNHPADRAGLGGRIDCIQDFTGAAAKFDVDFAAHLTVTNEVFVVGYPKGLTDQTLQPLWKRATVATDPRLGWQGQRKFLVDCASRAGLSGAPVLSYSRTGQMPVGGTTYMGSQPATLLHDIYVSRLGGGLEFEAQIGTVWSHTVIDEIIEAGVFGARSDDLEIGNVELKAFIRARWPSAKGDDFAHAVIHGHRPSGWFSHGLAIELNGRAGFKQIDDLVREEARNRCAPPPAPPES